METVTCIIGLIPIFLLQLKIRITKKYTTKVTKLRVKF